MPHEISRTSVRISDRLRSTSKSLSRLPPGTNSATMQKCPVGEVLTPNIATMLGCRLMVLYGVVSIERKIFLLHSLCLAHEISDCRSLLYHQLLHYTRPV